MPPHQLRATKRNDDAEVVDQPLMVQGFAERHPEDSLVGHRLWHVATAKRVIIAAAHVNDEIAALDGPKKANLLWQAVDPCFLSKLAAGGFMDRFVFLDLAARQVVAACLPRWVLLFDQQDFGPKDVRLWMGLWKAVHYVKNAG